MTYYTLSVIIILGFVAFRLARVLAVDTIGQPVRTWAYKGMADKGGKGREWLHTLLTCGYCLSVYFSVGAVLFYGLLINFWPGWEVLLAIPAVAGAAALMVSLDHALVMYVEKHPL